MGRPGGRRRGEWEMGMGIETEMGRVMDMEMGGRKE
jgi:hypothetical protein